MDCAWPCIGTAATVGTTAPTVRIPCPAMASTSIKSISAGWSIPRRLVLRRAKMLCLLCRALGLACIDKRHDLARRSMKFERADAPLFFSLSGMLEQYALAQRSAQGYLQIRRALAMSGPSFSTNRPAWDHGKPEYSSHSWRTLSIIDCLVSRCAFATARHEPAQQAQYQRREDQQNRSQNNAITQHSTAFRTGIFCPCTSLCYAFQPAQMRTSFCCLGPVTQARPAAVIMFTSLRTPNSPGR